MWNNEKLLGLNVRTNHDTILCSHKIIDHKQSDYEKEETGD